MSKLKWTIIAANLVLLLVYFNCSVGKKEKILSEGKLILLELAPVDPRSLMQGDYMELNYAISRNTQTFSDKIEPKRGFAVLKIDSVGVGHLVRLQARRSPLKPNEYLVEYTYNHWRINIGAESYFFEEGHAADFENAKYGGVRVDEKGNSVLVGLYDKNRDLIIQKKTVKKK